MADDAKKIPVAGHGSLRLPEVDVDSYNVELRDDEGFVGDRANREAFGQSLDKWREPLRKLGADPFGDKDTSELGKKELEAILTKGDPEAAGVVQGAIEDFAQELAGVIRRFLRVKGWRDTERIVIGGGFSSGRIGELAIGRASVLLKSDELPIEVTPIRHHPDEAGLIGAVHLAPSWIFAGHDGILGVDIGGTNIRAGVVQLNAKKAADLSKAEVWKSELWRHGDEKVTRDEAVERLVEMLRALVRRAEREGPVARAVHRHRLPRTHRGGRRDRARLAEPARQLGEQPLPAAAVPHRGDRFDRRARHRRRHAQRRRGPGA